MGDRMVVLRADDAVGFVADACAALADAVNEVRLSRSTDTGLVDTYAEMVVAYSRLLRRQWAEYPDHRSAVVRVNVVDHLVERLRQARDGEITVPVVDVIDRLHGELTCQPAGV